MKSLAWLAEYELGNEMVDEDHRKLLDLLNDVLAVARNGTNCEIGQKAIHQLICEASEHFAREELLMRQMQYPAYPAHKSEHERLILEIQAFYAKFQNGDLRLSNAVRNLLKDWVLEHMLTTDRTLAQSLLPPDQRGD